MFPRGLALLFLALLAAPELRADVTAALPLHGYFRPARFVPVRLQVHDVNATITIRAQNAVPTEYRATGSADVIVPWLPLLASSGEPQVSGSNSLDTTPHALSDDERLVVLAGSNADDARVLFPEKRVITIPLDLSRPLLAPPLAWEGVDGVVLSSAAAKQLDSVQIEVLASAGVVLAVRDNSRPDARWPWKRESDLWVLRLDPAGPRDVIEPAGYSPTYTWQRGWPIEFRRQILIAALVFILLATGISLWRSRATVLAFVALCAVSAGLLAWWYSRQSPVLELSGGVVISHDSLWQVDLWHWRSPLRSADATVRVDGLTYPILPDAKHANVTGLRLLCRSDGTPEMFQYHLDAQQSLAFLTRLLRTDLSHPGLMSAQEPFKSFADDLYLAPGQKIRGQFTATDPRSGRPLPLIVVAPGSQDH